MGGGVNRFVFLCTHNCSRLGKVCMYRIKNWLDYFCEDVVGLDRGLGCGCCEGVCISWENRHLRRSWSWSFSPYSGWLISAESSCMMLGRVSWLAAGSKESIGIIESILPQNGWCKILYSLGMFSFKHSMTSGMPDSPRY